MVGVWRLHQCGSSTKPARVTEHCLGAAIEILAALALRSCGYQIEDVYAFGLPRINARISDRFFRVAHHEDPVVQIRPTTSS